MYEYGARSDKLVRRGAYIIGVPLVGEDLFDYVSARRAVSGMAWAMDEALTRLPRPRHLLPLPRRLRPRLLRLSLCGKGCLRYRFRLLRQELMSANH